MTLTYLDMTSNFDHDLSRLYYAWLDALDETNMIESKSSFNLLKQRRYRRKPISVKDNILTSGDLNFDLSLKMTKVVSELYLTSFQIPFSALLYNAQEPR